MALGSAEASIGAFIMAGLLNLIFSLPESEELGIEGGGKVETPQDVDLENPTSQGAS
jgi:hypothetical protein